MAQAHLDWLTGAWDGLAERAAALAGDDEMLPLARLEAILVTGLIEAAAGAGDRAGGPVLVLAEGRQRAAVEACMEPSAALARLMLADGRTEEALADHRRAGRARGAKGTWVWAADIAPVRVEALVAAGRADEAAELVGVFAEDRPGRDAPAPRAALPCAGRSWPRPGQAARPARLFGRAAAAWQALPRPYEALLAAERQARCLLARRATARPARSCCGGIRAACPGWAPPAMPPGSPAACVSTACGRRPWRGGRRGYGNQLSPRELDVVRLDRGRTNRQMAEAIVPVTQDRGPAHGLAHAQARRVSRTALAVRAVEAGIGLIPGGPAGRAARVAPAKVRPPVFKLGLLPDSRRPLRSTLWGSSATPRSTGSRGRHAPHDLPRTAPGSGPGTGKDQAPGPQNRRAGPGDRARG